MSIRQRLLPLLLATTLLQAAPGWAGEAGQEPFRLSGFATLGVTWSGNEELGFRRDLYREGLFDGDASVKADSILGLQLDARFTDALGGAIQLVGKDRLENNLENSVEWAFLSYQLSPAWRLRAGRTGLDVYMLSEYRSLGFSYLWTRPPMEFYTPVPFDSLDGADITWEQPWGGGLLRAKLFAGKTKNSFQINYDVVELKLGKAVGGVLTWESDVWQWRVTASNNEVDEPSGYFPGMMPVVDLLLALEPFWPQAEELAASLETDGKQFQYYTAGVAYNNAPWQVQAEVGRVESRVEAYPSITNAYLSLGRQVGPVTLFGVLATAEGHDERLIVSTPPPPFEALQPDLQKLWDGLNIEQDSLSLGLRWDLRYDMALKVQWDRSWLDQYGVGMWDIRAMPANDPVIDTFSINLNCIF